MPNTTLYPDGHITEWTYTGSVDEMWEAISHGVATPVDGEFASGGATPAEVTLDNLPGGALSVNQASVVVRFRVVEDKDTPDRTLKLKVIDSADAALTNEVETGSPSAWTDSTIGFTVTDGTLSKWNDARLVMTQVGTEGDLEVSEVEVYATYGVAYVEGEPVILRPTLAVNTQFDTSNVLLIDDNVEAPTAGDGTTVEADFQDDDEEQIYGDFEHESLASVAEAFDHVTSVKVHVRVQDQGGSDDWVDVRILIDGVWESAQRITATGTMAWYEKEFTDPDWDPVDIDDIQVGLAVGSNPDMFFDVLYLEVDGTTDNDDGIPDDVALVAQPYTAFDWLAFYPGLWQLPDAGITITGAADITSAVNKDDAAPSEATYITLPDADCELWFNLGFLKPDYWQTHHFDFRIHGRRTDAAQGNTSYAPLYMQIFEGDGVTAITAETIVNNGGLNETWENKFIEDVERTGRSTVPIMVNAKVRLRQDYLGGDSHDIAAVAAFTTYVPLDVQEYTCVPVGDSVTTNYTSTEATNWEAVDNTIATPDDAELLSITDEVGETMLIMGPEPPADFYQPLHIASSARVKVSTMAGNRHNTLLEHWQADETNAFAGGVSGSAPPQAGAWFTQDHPDIVGINAVGTYYDWNEKTQIGPGPYTAGIDRAALTDWRLNIGSTNDNGTHSISEVEAEIKYSALPAVSYVAFERMFPAADATVDPGITSTEASHWEAINTRVQLSDDAKFITFPDADAEIFLTLTDMPKDLDTVHHFMFWLKYARTSATGEHCDLFMQLFAADETTALTDERQMNKDVSTSANIWKHHGELDVGKKSAVDSTGLGTARLRIRQVYRGGSGMKVTAGHIEVHYNPKELAQITLRPASDAGFLGFTSTEDTLWEATDAGIDTPDDTKYISLASDGFAQLVLAPAVPAKFYQVLDFELKYRARQSDIVYPGLTPSVELRASAAGYGVDGSETLVLNEDIETTWGAFATLAADDASAITLENGDDDAQTFGFASAVVIFHPKSIHKVKFTAKGEADNGTITLNVWLKVNLVWTSVETLLFTGGVQTLEVEWTGYELSQNQLDTLEVQVWADGLSPADEFIFEYCSVTVTGEVPVASSTLLSPYFGQGDAADTFQDFAPPKFVGATSAGFHSVHSRSIEGTGGSLADRDAWLWPIVEVEDAAAYGAGGDFDISEIELVVWYSALQTAASSSYLFRMMQGNKVMIRDTANQRWWVYAFDVTTGLPKTGDAANITADIYQNAGGAVATDDENPNEIAAGFYTFDLTQAETAAHTLALIPVSSTENISVVPCPPVFATNPANYGLLGIESDGDLTKVNTLDGHTAQTADHETRLAAQDAVLVAQDVILGNLPNAGALTDLTTIKDRIGAFAGSGVNTVLGFLKALGNKAATNPSELVDGGTFDAAADALEAIRDRGDVSWIPPTTGSGAYDVTITVEDEDDNPLGGAQVRMKLGGSISEGLTNASGVIVLACDNGSWSISITHITSVSYTGTVTVDADTVLTTFELEQTTTADPSAPGTSTGQILLMTDGAADVGAEYSIQYSRGGDLAGVSPDRSIQTATSNGSGIAQFPGMIHNAYYTLLGRGDGTVAASVSPFAKRSSSRLGEVLVPVGTSFSITE